jgi:hypothetical protein
MWPFGKKSESVPSSPPVSFGYKSMWLAVRSSDSREVAEALGLDRVRPVSWAKGLDEIQDDIRSRAVFVTPPIDGWVLAVLGTELDVADLDLAALSRRFGEAQKLATHRVVEYHEWQRWVDGSAVRRYCFVGDSNEISFDEGDPDDAEGSIARAEDLASERDDVEYPNEETVMEIAASWSVDPTTLDERTDLPGTGLLGTLR